MISTQEIKIQPITVVDSKNDTLTTQTVIEIIQPSRVKNETQIDVTEFKKIEVIQPNKVSVINDTVSTQIITTKESIEVIRPTIIQ